MSIAKPSVLRPPPAARHEAAIEAGGVVGGHRGIVTALVGLDEPQAPDREARGVELPEDGQNIAGCRHPHDDRPDAAPAGEVPVAHLEAPELGRPDGTAGPVGVPGSAAVTLEIFPKKEEPTPRRR